jgi:drug/metabolite transporter (DMT)-like permease
MLTYLLAILAACANATSSVLQRKANLEVPRSENLTLRLIWSLMHEPVWFGGILAIIAGFLLQASALSSGQLATVEPILVAELPFTLILAAWVFRHRMGPSEWLPSLAMTVGLVGLLYFLSPSSGRAANIRWSVWVTGIAGNLIVIGILVAAGRLVQNSRRAALLGIAAGAAFGLTAALIKGTTQILAHGLIALLTGWQVYAMIVSGLFGMFLTQSALNAGQLVAAQPGLTMTDPVVSILWGVLAFGERVRGGWHAAIAGVCAVIIGVGVVALARSPVLSGSRSASQRGQPGGAPTDRVTSRGRDEPG